MHLRFAAIGALMIILPYAVMFRGATRQGGMPMLLPGCGPQ
jgi:hypothetical protein